MSHAPHRLLLALVLGIGLLGATIACGGSLEAVPTTECRSGLKWVGEPTETHEMFPGRDCVGCHRKEGEGPDFTVAGTVYEHPDEPNDCAGVEGAEVLLTDADGRQWSLTTNRAGNFVLRDRIAFPIRSEITFDGRMPAVSPSIPNGRCAQCHTQDGNAGAPGRIVLGPQMP